MVVFGQGRYRLSATANGANVSVRSPFAPGAAAGVVGPTEPLVREHRLGLTVCGWEIRELAGCSTVVLICFTCPAITVVTVILWALDRVRGRALG